MPLACARTVPTFESLNKGPAMLNRHFLTGVCLCLLMATGADAQDKAKDINPTEQLIADLLITMAQIEVDLKNSGAEGIAPPATEDDLLDQTRDRVAALGQVDIPEPPDPQPTPDTIAEPLPDAPPPVESLVEAITPDGIDARPVSRDGRRVHSVLFQNLSDSEKAKLPVVNVDQCKALGDWFETLELQREVPAFFVIENTHVRICRKLAGSWFIKLAKRNNLAHLLEVAN